MKQLCLSLIISLFTSVVFAQMSVPPINAPTAPINAVAGVSGSFRLDILHNIDTSAFPDVGPVSIGSVRFKLPAGVKGDSSGCSDGSMPASGAKIPDCVIIYSWSGVQEGTYTIVTNLVLNLNVADSVIPLEIIISTPFVVSAGGNQPDPGSGQNPVPPNPSPSPSPSPNPIAPLPVSSYAPGMCQPGVGSSSIPGHSVINMETQSLTEEIPVVGAPFYLLYASDRLKVGTGFNKNSVSIGGWSLSEYHYFDRKKNIVYLGNGSKLTVSSVVPGSNGLVSVYSQDGDSIYRFNADGTHSDTISVQPSHIVWSFGYSEGKLSSISDKYGRRYLVGNSSITTPEGQVTSFSFDTNGNLNKVTNPNGESYVLTSDASGRLLTFQKPSGLKTTIEYDKAGNLLSDIGSGGSKISLNAEYIPERETLTVSSVSATNKTTTLRMKANAQGSQRMYVSDFGARSFVSSGNLEQGNSSQDMYGGITKYTYKNDPFTENNTQYVNSTRLVADGIDLTATISKDLNAVGAMTEISNQSSPGHNYKIVYYYKAAQKSYAISTPAGRNTNIVLNSDSNIASRQSPGVAMINYEYADRTKISAVTQGERTLRYSYDSVGNLSSVMDPSGLKSSFEYDKANRVTKQVFPDGASIAFAYDSDGNISSITPPGRQSHSFVRDLFGLVGKYLPPVVQAKGTGSTIYSYDLDKNLTKVSKADGSEISFGYEANSMRLSAIKAPNGVTSIQYEAAPKLSDLPKAILTPDDVKLDYQYTWRLPKSVTTSGVVSSAVSYTYSKSAILTAINIAGSDGKSVSNSIAYDFDNLVVGVGSLKMTRNEAGSVSSTSLGKVVEGIGYNTYGEVISSGFTVDKKPVFGMSYNRDKAGRITASQDVTATTKVVSTYEYDAQGRLVKVAKGSEVRTYSYDANGNRLGFTGGSKSYTGVYDDQDRLLSYGNSKFEYNDNGDLQTRTDINPETKDAKTTSYTYDVFGNLRKVILPDGRVIEYVIDGQNRRIGKKINGKVVQAFIYQNQLQIAAELDGNGKIVKSFVYASKVNVPDYVNYNGKQFRIISDQVGTPKMIVDSSNGQVVESFNYDEFGVSLDGKTSAIIPFGFAGGLYDGDTGLVRFGVRDYSPVVGRWTNKDPIGFNGGQGNLYVYSGTVGKVPGIETNLYGYSFQDPVNFIDPSGLYGVANTMNPDGPYPAEPGNCENIRACRQLVHDAQYAKWGSYLIRGNPAGSLFRNFLKGFDWATTPTEKEKRECGGLE